MLVVRASAVSRQDVPEYFERLRIEGRGLKESFHLVNAEPSTVPWEGVDIKGLVIASDSDLQKFFQEKRALEKLEGVLSPIS